MTAALASLVPLPRRSVPVPGSSVVAATEAYGVHVRAAVEAVRRSFGDDDSVSIAWAAMLASRWRDEPLATSATHRLQAAWGLVAMRVIGRSIGVLPAKASLRDAEAWFLGPLHPPRRLSDAVAELADRNAIKALEAIDYDETLRDLLPYVLDAHGPGSRASVMKDPGTRKARSAKRTGGVFYTPSDVAEYIAREAIGALGSETKRPTILDPACGSGVFLKAALDLAVDRNPDQDRLDFVENSLYGIDVNPLAIEAAGFVLLHECLASKPQETATRALVLVASHPLQPVCRGCAHLRARTDRGRLSWACFLANSPRHRLAAALARPSGHRDRRAAILPRNRPRQGIPGTRTRRGLHHRQPAVRGDRPA